MSTAVLVPAYNPDQKLLDFIDDLRARAEFARIIVVNDGSRRECESIFARLADFPDVTVLHHEVNLGKGAALKTGMQHFRREYPDYVGVVTADADGQHLADDVVRIAGLLEKSPRTLILGARRFAADVPLRSRFGNIVTRNVFWALAGMRISDTQSGLRGIPSSMTEELLTIKSNGYEFELEMLIRCKSQGIRVIECPITTVYLNDNESSHFSPIMDSLRIYYVLLRFVGTSLVTATVDYAVFLLTFALSSNVLLSQTLARAASVGVNFPLASRGVFRSQKGAKHTFPMFVLLVVSMGAVSYGLIQMFMLWFGWNVLAAKIAAESLVYVANFVIQRDVIFGNAATRLFARLRHPTERMAGA